MIDDPRTEPPATPEIQFDRAEFAASQGESEELVCHFCREPLRGEYFDMNRWTICRPCRRKVDGALRRQGGARGFLRAAGAGLVAAVAGAILYFAVREITGLELGLISILVGWGVGRAVHWGSKGKGGWLYQSLAIVLTYLAIVSTYLPLVLKQLEPERGAKSPIAAPASGGAASGTAGAPAGQPSFAEARSGKTPGTLDLVLGACGLLLVVAFIPFMNGLDNILGLLIIGFGLYQAWRLNRRSPLAISGPFQVRGLPAGAP